MGKHRYGIVLGMSALAAVAMVCTLGAGVAFAGEKAEIGKAMPDFEMKDTTGKMHRLSDYEGKVVVLQFCSHECPWSRGADPHISDMAKQYKDKNVVVFGINSHYGASPDEIAAYLEENNLDITVLKDTNNEYADKVGANQTPEFFVVDQEGKLAYHGAFDNRKAPAKEGDTNYVANAVDSLLANEPVKVAEQKAWGCSIGRAPKADS